MTLQSERNDQLDLAKPIPSNRVPGRSAWDVGLRFFGVFGLCMAWFWVLRAHAIEASPWVLVASCLLPSWVLWGAAWQWRGNHELGQSLLFSGACTFVSALWVMVEAFRIQPFVSFLQLGSLGLLASMGLWMRCRRVLWLVFGILLFFGVREAWVQRQPLWLLVPMVCLIAGGHWYGLDARRRRRLFWITACATGQVWVLAHLLLGWSSYPGESVYVAQLVVLLNLALVLFAAHAPRLFPGAFDREDRFLDGLGRVGLFVAGYPLLFPWVQLVKRRLSIEAIPRQSMDGKLRTLVLMLVVVLLIGLLISGLRSHRWHRVGAQMVLVGVLATVFILNGLHPQVLAPWMGAVCAMLLFAGIAHTMEIARSQGQTGLRNAATISLALWWCAVHFFVWRALGPAVSWLLEAGMIGLLGCWLGFHHRVEAPAEKA